MDIYSKLLFNTIGVNIKESEFMINSNNRWEDVYTNKYYRELTYRHSNIIQYIFTLLEPKYNKTKIKFWYETVNNMFFSQETRDRLWDKFTKSQKKYYVLSKFVTMCKYKYTKVKVNIDLNLNKIIFPSNNGLKIYQDGALYYFTMNDIINICNSSLTFSYHFFSEAYVPKNPYTNNNFTYPILLKIYYTIRFSYFKMPLLLEMFYRSDFNIKKFKKTNEYFIREECIKSFMKNADKDEHFEYIEEILDMRECKRMFSFDEDFPKDVLLKAFRPYLFVYLISKYSLRSSRKMFEYKTMLKSSLREFKRTNPAFGRNIIQTTKHWSHTKNRHIFIKKTITVTDFKEESISLPSFRELISDVLFKDDSDSESDSDDETIENVILSRPNAMYIPRTPSVTPPNEVNDATEDIHTSPLYNGNNSHWNVSNVTDMSELFVENRDISSNTESDSDDENIEVIINNSNQIIIEEESDGELNDTDSMS